MNTINNKPVITLRKIVYQKKYFLALEFAYNFSLKELVKNIEGFRFSRTKKAWVAPFSKKRIAIVKNKLGDNVVFIDDRSLYREQKPKRNISEEKKNVVRKYVQYLKGKRYSESTVKTYFTFIADFVEYIGTKELNQLVNRDIELFIENVLVPKKASISTHRQFISAIKHFAVFYPECSIDGLELTRPKKSRYLPTVLSQEEIIDLIRTCKNLKHRAIITLIYSSGLRIGEVLSLKLRDIDIDRCQILIKNGKGRKDRYVSLAKSFLPLLQNYLVTYRPEVYFVEGTIGSQYSASSVRKFLWRCVKELGIEKKVTPHTLRHSYATHMLENGIGIRHIQELLGHSKPETTMIYTHIAKKDLLDIESPLDNIILSLSKTKKSLDKKTPNILLSGNKNKQQGQ